MRDSIDDERARSALVASAEALEREADAIEAEHLRAAQTAGFPAPEEWMDGKTR